MNRLKSIEDLLGNENKRFMRKLKRRHRIIFAMLVFIGAVFLWYGIWTIISEVPVINNPYISTILGMIILLATGMYYNNTL
jgi:hypothetical protein